MDYPKSKDEARLHEGRFTDGIPGEGVFPSKNRSDNLNVVYDELLKLITDSGLEPNETVRTQVSEAVSRVANSVATTVATNLINDLIDGAPATLDTLKEVANKLADINNVFVKRDYGSGRHVGSGGNHIVDFWNYPGATTEKQYRCTISHQDTGRYRFSFQEHVDSALNAVDARDFLIQITLSPGADSDEFSAQIEDLQQGYQELVIATENNTRNNCAFNFMVSKI